ncbi:hypothetical protein GCM10025868_15150 [Angustibacter aerolatus]|uniref:Uncharacterized protein n=1 Tax=Angustibacter aerolatus TaxID=1162965 RepID=A0ABQ6JDJ5_9ACTN|nr:hypothetical protein GCM10025868_15150 [Angustibacter aerolatus]
MPTDDTNLALRAARLVATRGEVEQGAVLEPAQGHPGGGRHGGRLGRRRRRARGLRSGLAHRDVARRACTRWPASLGSDVAFALVGGTAIGQGRGEQISPALARGQYHWVLALSATGLSTAAVYAEHDRLATGHQPAEPRVADAVMQALRTGDAVALGRSLRNDLQRAAVSLRPELGDLVEPGAGVRRPRRRRERLGADRRLPGARPRARARPVGGAHGVRRLRAGQARARPGARRPHRRPAEDPVSTKGRAWPTTW